MTDRKPNIVWFITDDTGFNMLGYSGGPVLTPNIDRIASEGVICTHFFTASPACTPSRYSYLTGHYPGNCKAPRFLRNNPTDTQAQIDFNVDVMPGSVNLASLLKENGYATGFSGKWHTGIPRGELTENRYDFEADPADPEVAKKLEEDYAAMREQVMGAGFDFADGVCWGNTDNRPLRKLQFHNLEWTTAAALEFLDNQKDADQPFFLNMATTTIHGPHHVDSMKLEGIETEKGYIDAMPQVQPPRETVFKRLEAAGLEVTHQSAGALWMDDSFGAVMRKVEEMGQADNTIFIWSTDHGPGTIDAKFSLYEGGMRIPYCMMWKGHIPEGSVSDARIQNIDFIPTLMDMIGCELPAELPIDGESRWKHIRGKENDRREIYGEFGYARSISTSKWKYIAWRHTPEQIERMKNGKVDKAFNMRGLPSGEFAMHMFPHYFDPDQLYDLENDPGEQKNLVGDPKYADVLDEMQTRLKRKLAKFDHPFPLDEVDPFVLSEKYKQLCEKTLADKRMYEADWYKAKAY